MSTAVDHHVAFRVADIDRSIRFYTEALGGRLATLPAERSGGYFDATFGPGAAMRICYIRFDRGGTIELFEFLSPKNDVPPAVQTVDAIMHIGVTVDDVPAVLERVLASGGRARTEVRHMGNRDGAPRFVYCEDPDGHLLELLEADSEETIREVLKSVPSAAPGGAGGGDTP